MIIENLVTFIVFCSKP